MSLIPDLNQQNNAGQINEAPGVATPDAAPVGDPMADLGLADLVGQAGLTEGTANASMGLDDAMLQMTNQGADAAAEGMLSGFLFN
jgi:hypothetical protein